MRRSRSWIRWDSTTLRRWWCAPRRGKARQLERRGSGTPKRWKLGITSEFQSRSDGLQALAPYHLPRVAAHSGSETALCRARKGHVDMIATRATDGHLTLPGWKVLADDQKVFPSYDACLLVRKDLIAAEPGLRPALAELSGKIQRGHHAEAERRGGRGASARGRRGRRFPDPGRFEVTRRSAYATTCGSGRTPSCRRQRSIHCLVSFSCTPFCDRRVRRLLQST